MNSSFAFEYLSAGSFFFFVVFSLPPLFSAVLGVETFCEKVQMVIFTPN
jgi:hypothetical protein